MERQTTGIYHKFNVSRVDGTDQPGQKHDGCQYFVLDLTHDKHAPAAMAAYAASCRENYPALAADCEVYAKAAGHVDEAKFIRARVAQLEGAIRKCQAWKRLEISAEWPEVAHDMDVALSATPAQSLARVRAEAVGEALALIEPNTEYWADVEALKERLEAEAANG